MKDFFEFLANLTDICFIIWQRRVLRSKLYQVEIFFTTGNYEVRIHVKKTYRNLQRGRIRFSVIFNQSGKEVISWEEAYNPLGMKTSPLNHLFATGYARILSCGPSEVQPEFIVHQSNLLREIFSGKNTVIE